MSVPIIGGASDVPVVGESRELRLTTQAENIPDHLGAERMGLIDTILRKKTIEAGREIERLLEKWGQGAPGSRWVSRTIVSERQ